jgi:hypothetical protein
LCSYLRFGGGTDSSVLASGMGAASPTGHRTPRMAPPTLVPRGCTRPELVEGRVVCVVHNGRMCRNIRPLHNFEPPASKGEVHDAALQYVRKIAGTSKPSKANEEAFNRAVNEIAHATQHLLEDLVSGAPPKNRDVEAAKAKARSANRFATA